MWNCDKCKYLTANFVISPKAWVSRMTSSRSVSTRALRRTTMVKYDAPNTCTSILQIFCRLFKFRGCKACHIILNNINIKNSSNVRYLHHHGKTQQSLADGWFTPTTIWTSTLRIFGRIRKIHFIAFLICYSFNNIYLQQHRTQPRNLKPGKHVTARTPPN